MPFRNQVLSHDNQLQEYLIEMGQNSSKTSQFKVFFDIK